MFQIDSLGRWLLVIGLGVAALGLLFILFGRLPLLNRFGSLPGNIRFQSADGRFSCFVPIVSSILISVILTVVLNVVIRLLNR